MGLLVKTLGESSLTSVPDGILTKQMLAFEMNVIFIMVLIPSYGSTRQTLNTRHNSRNAVRRVLYDSPRIADDDRRERLNMKRYGIWKITLVTVSGVVFICEITARSGKDARSRAEKRYEDCQILKMERIKWLTDFSYDAISILLHDAYPEYGSSLLEILSDNGVFSGLGAD